MKRSGALVFLVALAARLAVVAWAHGRIPPTGDGHYYHVLAARLAAGEGYTWLWPDGVVTPAAHYPVGYPALLAGPYALFGASPTVAMVIHAVIGALGCLAVERLLTREGDARAGVFAGLVAALHPGLLAYTAAVMTEGVVGALLAIAAFIAVRDDRRLRRLIVLGGVMGLATLVRPQVVLLAPLFGLLAARGVAARLASAALVLSIAVVICAPWTLRNCEVMGRCAFVSVNGGWNLLIGTEPGGGGTWVPLETPPACRTVWDEAEKDACFAEVARERITSAPGDFVALAPRKVEATFEQGGAPAWYLHTAAPEAFGAGARDALTLVEILLARALIALGLLAAWQRPRSRRSFVVASLVVIGLVTVAFQAAIAFLAFALAVALRRDRPVALAAPAAVVVVTAIVHAIFFGGGRYQLVLHPLLAASAGLGAIRLVAIVTGLRRTRRRRRGRPALASGRNGPRGGEEARS